MKLLVHLATLFGCRTWRRSQTQRNHQQNWNWALPQTDPDEAAQLQGEPGGSKGAGPETDRKCRGNLEVSFHQAPMKTCPIISTTEEDYND